ncbi:MAG: putative bifunctional diguanylate cyclase/phosphodiesterase [Kordiimonas sp.]
MMSLKFQTRLTIVYLALFLAVQGIIILAFYTSVTRNVGEQVQDQLSASARVFERIIEERISELGGRAQDLASDFGFRQAVGTEDVATIESALQNLSGRIGADLAFVYDSENNIITMGQGDTHADAMPSLPEDLKELSELEGVAQTIAEIDGQIYELVVVPVRAPLPVAWIALGIELDKVAALEIKGLSPIDLEVAFLYEEDGRYQLASSTSETDSLGQFVSGDMRADMGAVFRSSFQDEEYMFWRLSLVEQTEDTSEIAALVYFSMDKALQPYMALALTLSGILFIGLFMLVGGSVIISRGVTRPLRRLANATHQIATGDYREVEATTKDDEISALTSSFNQMVDAVKEREERIVFQSYHDNETGLSNRIAFENDLEKAVADREKFVVAVVEVQQLAELRSVLNHNHVNELLKGIGKRIETIVGTSVARVSTESFCFILDDVSGADVVPSLIVNSFLTPFNVLDITIDASVKIGTTRFPEDSKDPAKLMQHVNSALDLARSSTKGVASYVADNSEAFKSRLSMMSDLREALGTGEVAFAYQPKFDLAAGKISSVEALVRWNSASRGFVAPDDFIPFAERTGDIRHVTEWGLKEAVSQCAKWKKNGIDMTVALNLSTSDLMNQNLPGQVLALLNEYSLSASNLKLEVTESAVMHDMNRALDVLNMLSAMGMELSIDDYGTGYSSLSYLKKLPVNELKIDKSFVLKLAHNEEDRILVRSTIELGHNLGLKITAEGVEDEASVNMLRDYGCDTLQGYFISRPLPAADLEIFLKEAKFDWA